MHNHFVLFTAVYVYKRDHIYINDNYLRDHKMLSGGSILCLYKRSGILDSFLHLKRFLRAFSSYPIKKQSVDNLERHLSIYIFILSYIISPKTIILPVVLYGCETWSLTLREDHRLRMFGNRVLRRIFGPKRDEVMGEWRKLHNEELRDLYSSPSIIRIIKSRRMRWAGHVARMGEKRKAYRLLVGKPEGKRPLGRQKHRCVDNIRMDL
jgi:hypothetical protein